MASKIGSETTGGARLLVTLVALVLVIVMVYAMFSTQDPTRQTSSTDRGERLHRFQENLDDLGTTINQQTGEIM
jgi:uncharacterized membrane protein